MRGAEEPAAPQAEPPPEERAGEPGPEEEPGPGEELPESEPEPEEEPAAGTRPAELPAMR